MVLDELVQAHQPGSNIIVRQDLVNERLARIYRGYALGRDADVINAPVQAFPEVLQAPANGPKLFRDQGDLGPVLAIPLRYPVAGGLAVHPRTP